LIAYMTESVNIADRPDDRTLWEQAAKVIIPTLEYAQSLEATPDCSIRRSIPPAGLGLATVVIVRLAATTRVEITYEKKLIDKCPTSP
jgi:hypothetical protein